MSDAPLIIAAPPLRCGHRDRKLGSQFCARPAVSFRSGSPWELPEYHCARHAGGTDVPLPLERVFRRVRLMAHVDFAAVSARVTLAESEAMSRLERAVIDAGGLLTNVHAGSAVVRHRPQGLETVANGDRGNG